ncbi:MAG: cyclic nucleotide-binding domain-containing protein [Spirochaetales bacterium]
MKKMPVISTDLELNGVIKRITEKFHDVFIPEFIDSAESALEYLKYELPEMSLINLSDFRIDAKNILEDIKADPWLHYGGIIGVYIRKDAPKAEEIVKNTNIISLIPRSEMVWGFYRVLKIIYQNRHFLFHRDLQRDLLKTISGTFIMENDPFQIRTYVNLITNYLFNIGYLSQEQRDKLHVALFELLMNAVEHGNCEITYEEKSNWLNMGKDGLELIREKLKNPVLRDRKVYFSYRIGLEQSTFVIRDEGKGFDWRKYLEERKGKLELHGHGIKMTNLYVQNLRYNDKGNEVAFDIRHQTRKGEVVPGLFANREEVIFEDGETVFTEGEESNYLYYIASGTLKIYSKGKHISTLTPEDILLGEMSFLLNNRRSATVISEGRSILYKISKNEFMNIVKEKPHYGILLARLIAQRLSKLNTHVANLKGKAM